jgi:hypothetical protein
MRSLRSCTIRPVLSLQIKEDEMQQELKDIRNAYTALVVRPERKRPL